MAELLPLCAEPIGAHLPDTLIINRARALDDTIYRIPLVITILYNQDSENAIFTEEVIANHIKFINDDFRGRNADKVNVIPEYQNKIADIGFEFFLKEVRRKKTDTVLFTSFFNVWDVTQGGIPALDPIHNCNLMFCNIDFAGGVSVYPNSGSQGAIWDGSIVRIKSFAPNGVPNTRGQRISTHELGHWFWLAHTFSNGCNPPGDWCEQTPSIPSPTTGIQLSRKACDGITIADTQNHMDYADERFHFVHDQKDRMRSTVQSIRSPLVTGTPPPPPSTNKPPVVRFDNPPGNSSIPIRASMNVKISATDDVKVSRVELWINNGLQKTWTATPYELPISFPAAGVFLLQAKAYDAVGAVGVSSVVAITVTGVTPPPPTGKEPVVETYYQGGKVFFRTAQRTISAIVQ